ncbi:unnamed protein product [Schistocephalus solidus]|uniref:Uncharacterized protein n=1 Tax=Schistocephalus solidus TaxID=70667 RepID=A0A183T314_SCHSO|nr:unnamed protein product [Schistocephalus solidus]
MLTDERITTSSSPNEAQTSTPPKAPDDERSEAGERTALTLISLLFYALLMDAYRKEGPGIRITQMRVSTATVHDFLFVEYCAFNTVREKDIQKIMDLFFAGCA